MYTDPIADMLTRIRNAQMVKKSEVLLPYSKIKYNIAKILEQTGWLDSVEKISPLLPSQSLTKNNQDTNAKFDQIKIKLLYHGTQPKITSLKRVSKPGRRIYVSHQELPIVLNNYGLAIISTSQGLMTNIQAKHQGIGGEIICEIY